MERLRKTITPLLGKLLPLLGSNHDGEVVAAARAISRVLQRAGHGWHDLTNALLGFWRAPTRYALILVIKKNARNASGDTLERLRSALRGINDRKEAST